MTRNGAMRTAYMVTAGAIAIGSLSYSVGAGNSRRDVAAIMATVEVQQKEGHERELRLQAIERLCARWDERWTNLQGWMARIDGKLPDMNIQTER